MDNKAKTWFVLIACIIVAVIAFVFGAYVYNKKTARNDEPVNIEKLSQVEEIKENSIYNEIETSTSESKVSPNAIVNEKRYYKKCDHLIRETVDIPEELVNMSEEDVKKYYEGWNIEKYTPTEITIYKEFSGICNEHYIVKKNGDVLGIYIENDDGVEDDGEQLTGYWITKYQLSREEKDARITAELAAGTDCSKETGTR